MRVKLLLFSPERYLVNPPKFTGMFSCSAKFCRFRWNVSTPPCNGLLFLAAQRALAFRPQAHCAFYIAVSA